MAKKKIAGTTCIIPFHDKHAVPLQEYSGMQVKILAILFVSMQNAEEASLKQHDNKFPL